jgi:hypothetical protein
MAQVCAVCSPPKAKWCAVAEGVLSVIGMFRQLTFAITRLGTVVAPTAITGFPMPSPRTVMLVTAARTERA